MYVLGYYEFTVKIMYKKLIENKTVLKFIHYYKEKSVFRQELLLKARLLYFNIKYIIWSMKH